MNKGVIYVVSNDCFNFLPNCYKIGLTTNIENRKNDYKTTYPSDCKWEYVSPEVTYIRTRERLIFKRLNEYRCRTNREFFSCELPIILETIEYVLKRSYKEMCEELGIKDYNLEYDKFFKTIVKKTEKSKYDKVFVGTLHLAFNSWCKAKCIKKIPSYEEFCEKVQDKKFKIKTTKTEDEEYLEKVEFKV